MLWLIYDLNLCHGGLDIILHRAVLLYSLQTGSKPSCTELFYYTPCKQGLDTILPRAVLLYPANRGLTQSCTELFCYTPCKQGLDTVLQTGTRNHPAQSCSFILPANRGCSVILPANKGLTQSCKQGLETILHRAVLLYSLQTGARYHPAQSCSDSHCQYRCL